MNKKAGLKLVGIALFILISILVFSNNGILADGGNYTNETNQTIPEIDYSSYNINLINYNQNGYTYSSNNTRYDFYVKCASNWGDGTKFCVGSDCLIYQPQDLSYRNQDGSQDYISSLQYSQGVVNNETISFSNVFPNTDLNYTASNSNVKEIFTLKQKPKIPASYLGTNISLDIGGYIKYETLEVWANGVKQSGDFKTTGQIEFKKDNKTLFYLPKPIAWDSNGTYQDLEYEVKKQGNSIWFYTRTPYTFIENAVYPVYIDPSTNLTNGTVLYYKLDESSGVAYDSTGNGKNGTVTGATQGVVGKINKSYSFDGSGDYINTGIDITDYSSYTVGFYFKYNDTGNYIMLGQDKSGDRKLAISYVTGQPSGQRFSVYDGTNLNYAPDINANTWKHIIITNDKSSLRIYYNGLSVTNGTGTIGASSSIFLWIGGREYTGVNDWFKGNIDEVVLYNYALNVTGAIDLYDKMYNNISYPFEEGGASDTTPPTFTTIPANATLNYLIDSLGVDFDATDETSFGTFSVNDTRFLINSTGWLSNSTILGVGNYSLNISINDSSGNQNSTIYLVTVNKATPTGSIAGTTPIWYGASADVTATENNLGDNDLTYKLYRNGTEVSNPDTSSLLPSSYHYTYNTTGGANYSSSELDSFDLIVQNDYPILSNIRWKTTGGFTALNLLYLQTIDYINITASDNNTINVYLDVYNSDGTKIIDNQSMTEYDTNEYSYSTDFQLNKAGSWTFNFTSIDSAGYSNTSSQLITIGVQVQSIKDGWYGYSNKGILNSTQIVELSNYGYDIFEIEENSSSLVSNWDAIKNSINNSRNVNIKAGLNILLDFDYNSSSEKSELITNLSSILGDLINIPYTDTVRYISLELVNSNLYNSTQKSLILNEISENITGTISNEYVIYSKNYDVSLDSSYIQSTTLLYLSPQDNTSFINDQLNLFKSNTSLNRIYYNIPDSVKITTKSFQESIIENLRSTISSTSLSNVYTSALNNGDILVFNNESSEKNITVVVTELTDNSGKDAWDYTNNLIVEMNNDLTFNVTVPAYSSVNVIFEDLDHIEILSSLSSSYVYKGGSSTVKYSNHTNGTLYDNFGLYGAVDLAIELYDPNYVHGNFMTYYGWINVTDSPSFWDNYDVVVLADKNNEELDKLNYTETDFYGYISVADYTDETATTWLTEKEAEVDLWLSLNDSLNIFIDGLDYSVGGDNFSIYMKTLVDYIQIDKNQSVILNTYTAYQDFATWGKGGIMKESCVNRWNGLDAGTPSSYTRENWSLELERSNWFQNHNVNVYCQSFSNRTIDGTNIILNWTDMQNIYFASKVLGYDYFYLSQPDFNYAHEEYVYDVGNDLDNSYHQMSEDSNTYYRTYEKGIVYYNSTSGQGWIEDGRTINNMLACFYLYDPFIGGAEFRFNINEGLSIDFEGEYNISDGWGVGTWSWQCADISNEEPLNGRYLIHMWAGDHTVIVGQGFNLGNSVVAGTGKHSFYDISSGTNSFTPYSSGQNWMVNLSINQSNKISIDTTQRISQTENLVGNDIYFNISSNISFPIEVWSYPIVSNQINFTAIQYKNSTGDWINLSLTNTTTCESNEPIFNTTVIESKTHRACYTQNSTNTIFRVATPDLSIQEYLFLTEESDITPPIFVTIPNNVTIQYLQTWEGVYFNATDETSFGTFSVNDSNFTINSTGYLTNSTILETGNYSLNISISDTAGNENSTMFLVEVIDTIPPTLTIINPSPSQIISGDAITLNISTNERTSCTYYLSEVYNGNMITLDSLTQTKPLRLPYGTYTALFICNDTSNNTANASVTFEMQKTTGTIGTSSSSSTTSTTTEDKIIILNNSLNITLDKVIIETSKICSNEKSKIYFKPVSLNGSLVTFDSAEFYINDSMISNSPKSDLAKNLYYFDINSQEKDINVTIKVTQNSKEVNKSIIVKVEGCETIIEKIDKNSNYVLISLGGLMVILLFSYILKKKR